MRRGGSWGERLAAERFGDPVEPVELAAEFLADHGFEPRVDPEQQGEGAGSAGAREITLLNCPFRELVDSYGVVVCELHAGLLEGLIQGEQSGLGAAGASARVDVVPSTLRPRVGRA